MDKFKCTKYKALRSGMLVASVSILVEKLSLQIHDIAIFEKDGRRWMSFPSKVYEKDGKKNYLAYIHFTDKKMDEKFKEAVLNCVKEYEDELKSNEVINNRVSPQFNYNDTIMEEELPF